MEGTSFIESTCRESTYIAAIDACQQQSDVPTPRCGVAGANHRLKEGCEIRSPWSGQDRIGPNICWEKPLRDAPQPRDRGVGIPVLHAAHELPAGQGRDIPDPCPSACRIHDRPSRTAD